MTIAVTFKCEDYDDDGTPIGPVYVIDLDARASDPNVGASLGMPFGYDPPWMDNRGWVRHDAAERIAADHGVSLSEDGIA